MTDEQAIVIRAGKAERLACRQGTIDLLTDAGDVTHGPHVHRTKLCDGATATGPHHHLKSSEMFFVLDGALQVLLGEELVTLEQGDLVVIPPGVVHAYGAAPSHDADVLVLFTPGVPLHDFLRCFIGVVNGERSPDGLAELIPRCDMHRDQSGAWAAARPGPGPTG